MVEVREKISQLNLSEKLKFGLEIEADISMNTLRRVVDYLILTKESDNLNFSVVKDISVPNGGEIVTSPMTDDIKNWSDLKFLLVLLQKENIMVSPDCGFHMHFNADYFESKNNNWLDLLELWLAYEQIIYYFSFNKKILGREEFMEYAVPLNVNADVYYKFIDYFRKYKTNLFEANEYFEEFYQNNLLNRNFLIDVPLVKDCGLNISNVIYDKNISDFEILKKKNKPTIEVRCPDCAYDFTEIQTMISFFGRMLEVCHDGLIDSEKLRFNRRKLTDKQMNDMFTNYFTYQKENVLGAEELFSLVANNAFEEEMYMRQYVKNR